METFVINTTYSPVTMIAQAAGMSYGRQDHSIERVIKCFKNNHMSVFEHASVTLRVVGISRACSHQLVRHRMASFVQKSQRYTTLDDMDKDWYVVPEAIIDHPYFKAYEALMDHAETLYFELLDHGVKPEDARYILPEATKTDIVVTMNVRELFHFFDLRLDEHAQWEIRELANHIKNDLSNYSKGWKLLIAIYDNDEEEINQWLAKTK